MQAVSNRKSPSLAWQAFIFALIIGAAIFLPFVIMDKGYFIYYGDFNVQQIPFYKLAHEAVRSGDVLWNWYTDLGANFIGSDSFYLLFSPFFWITLPFPTWMLPFFMAPLLVLKTACASWTAYLYLSRFVKDTRFALLAALLYAFSGWMDFNIFFNHFHEPAIFFPLLLLGVEKLVTEDKKFFFAAMVAVNAMVNYWFFVGEAVFVAIYIFVRMTDKNWRMSAIKFVRLTLEAVLGVGLAAVVLVPSVMALMGNPRTSVEDLAMGWNAWLYWHEQRQPAILQSILFPPELPARPNFFEDHGAKWSSLSAWLPMFSITGVLAYFFARKDDWLKKILALSLLFALVPGLNSLFILLNNSYYARWYFMPILLMAMATARSLEDSERDTKHFARAIKWVGILLAVFALMCGVTPHLEEKKLVFGMAKDPLLMWVYTGIAFVGLAVTGIMVLHQRHNKKFAKILIASVSIFSVAFTIFYMASGKGNFERSDFVINTAIKGRDQIALPQEQFARADAFDAQDNILMFWHLPNIQAFHSIVPTSIMEFYPKVGVKRDVGSRPEKEFWALRPLLSVRWLFIENSDDKDQNPMPGYTKFAEQAGFNIYENDNFIPMGFSYDDCISNDNLEDVAEAKRSNMMLKAIVLDDDAISRNSDILSKIKVTGTEDFSEIAMSEDSAQRGWYTVDSFAIDNRGFTATSFFDTERIVFFSVPWEKGWSATVNGQKAQIERANIGFMAVRVPAGESEIRFNYFTPGLIYGAIITVCFLLIFAAYAIIAIVAAKKRKAAEPTVEQLILNGIPVQMSLDEYLAKYGDKAARAAHLQRVLNESAAKQMPEQLSDDDVTFHFSIDEDNKGNSDNNIK